MQCRHWPVDQCMEQTMAKQSTKTRGKSDASKKPLTVRASSKLGQLEAMLRRPSGATIPQLAKALDWQAHSIRGAISGALKKKRGLKITASKEEGADRVYRVAA
jgi:hypothetical protein